MAIASGYEHDIFISYAHDDNHSPGDLRGWVDQFHEWLDSWLSKRRGLPELSIWLDSRRMTGNTLFDGAIRNAVNRSALFFALVSRNYLNSDYCRDELNWFHRQNSRLPSGLKVGDQYRIFTILLNNIPHCEYQQWSPALKGTIGFAFHDANTDQELGDFISTHDDRFEKQLRPLVDAVEAILIPIATSRPTPATEGVEPQANTVYFADAAETLMPFRKRLIAEVEGQRGIILQTIPPPWGFDAHAEMVKKTMDKARFSIHLFDQWQGRTIIDREETNYPREQFAAAVKSQTHPLIWVPPDLDMGTIENDTQRQFLLDCSQGDRKAVQFEFVCSTHSAFINLILEKLAAPVPASPPPHDGQSYLVDTHQKDQRFAFKLADYLAGLGVEVDFNHESGDPLVSLDKFEKAIRQVKNLIIMFGKVAPDWLNARIKLALKAICEQFQSDERCALENIWIYRVPASQGDIPLPPLPPVINIRILDNSHTPSIDPAIAVQLVPAAHAAGGGP